MSPHRRSRSWRTAIRANGARHAILGPFVYQDALYSALPAGGVLARYGVGHDGIDKARATSAGLLCTNTPDVLHQSVAELTLLLILAAARHFEAVAGECAAGMDDRAPVSSCRARPLAIIGCGTIGRATARSPRLDSACALSAISRSARCTASDRDFDSHDD